MPLNTKHALKKAKKCSKKGKIRKNEKKMLKNAIIIKIGALFITCWKGNAAQKILLVLEDNIYQHKKQKVTNQFIYEFADKITVNINIGFNFSLYCTITLKFLLLYFWFNYWPVGHVKEK